MILLTKSGYMRGGRRIEETDETGGQNKSTECRPAEQSPAWRYSRGTGMDRWDQKISPDLPGLGWWRG